MVLNSVLLAVLVVLLAAHRIWSYTKARLPTIIDRLIDRAINRLPYEKRDRFAEEWKGYVNDRSGDLRKLIVAVGFLFAAKEMADGPRWYDRVGAALLLAFCAPLLFFTAVMIATSGRPLLLGQGLVRADGKRIRRLTFRTIVADPELLRAISEGADLPLKLNDPRLTAVGRVLGALRFDRLPLLLNVLKGDISLLAVHQEVVNVAAAWTMEEVWATWTMEANRGWSWFCAGAAGLMVILAFLIITSTPSKPGFPQMAEVSRIARSDTDADKHEMLGVPLTLGYGSSGNSCGDADHLRKVLDAHPSIRIIHIYRCGGPLAEARKLGDLIRERKLVTYIGLPGTPPALLATSLGGTPCAAACRVVFMGGVQRFMAPEAKLGFHRGSFPLITDEKLAQADEELAQADEELAQADEELAHENEVARVGLIAVWVRAWFANHADSTPSDSMVWATSDELKRAGIITGVASPNDLEVWLRQGTL
jgi:hypothetical protein